MTMAAPPPTDDGQTSTPPDYRNILVLVDDGPDGHVAAVVAGSLAEASNARLRLVGAVHRPSFFVEQYVPRRQLIEQAERALEKRMRRAICEIPVSVTVSTKVSYGPAGKVVLGEAADGAYDLVVLGAARRRGVARWTRALRRTDTSLLIVHARDLDLLIPAAPR